LPVIEFVLPEDGTGISCRGYAQKQVVNGREWGWFHWGAWAVSKDGG